ncbi:hypothetical protein C8R43DRAFT_1113948 [Mycena crocata]|nr:hypothetical protein C8R43DRAFT_1113948 [Mycena crocata]
MDTTTDLDTTINNAAIPPRALKDYLIGPKTNILPAHGWTHTSVLFNHLPENVDKVLKKPTNGEAKRSSGADDYRRGIAPMTSLLVMDLFVARLAIRLYKDSRRLIRRYGTYLGEFFCEREFNNEKINPTKFRAHLSSLVAVIIGRDRPSDRAMAADAIADAMVSVGLAAQDEFTVVPATPNEGDPDTPILPHTNLILCNSSALKDKLSTEPTKAIVHARRKDDSDGFSFYLLPALPEASWYIGCFVGLSDRLTRDEFITAFFKKLVADLDVLKLIQDHHDRVPDAPDITFVVRVLLEYAEVRPCQVWMPGRRGSGGQRQNAVRLYMPPPSLLDDAIKVWKTLLTSPSFTFIVDCRGRATPFKPEAGRTGRARPMECNECLGIDHYKDDCPIIASPDFRATHLNQSELDSAHVGTSLGTIRDREEIDADGFKRVGRRPFNSRFVPGGYKRRDFAGRMRR